MVIGYEQLDELQKRNIDGYATGAYVPINHYLRNDPESDLTGDLKRMSEKIDSVFKLSPVRPNPLIVFRGTQNNTIYDNPVFTDKGYISTSINENIAHKFIPENNGLLLKIYLQCSNIKLLEIKGIIKENEYLIWRNTPFRVLYRGDGIKTVKNQIVPCIGICPC